MLFETIFFDFEGGKSSTSLVKILLKKHGVVREDQVFGTCYVDQSSFSKNPF